MFHSDGYCWSLTFSIQSTAAVEPLLNGDMGHGGSARRAMPVLLAGREADDIARPDLLEGPPSAAPSRSPEVTIRVWPSGWVCHAVRAPGPNVTPAPLTREPLRLISIAVPFDRRASPIDCRRERIKGARLSRLAAIIGKDL